jgi:hypothetical protein
MSTKRVRAPAAPPTNLEPWSGRVDLAPYVEELRDHLIEWPSARVAIAFGAACLFLYALWRTTRLFR